MIRSAVSGRAVPWNTQTSSRGAPARARRAASRAKRAASAGLSYTSTRVMRGGGGDGAAAAAAAAHEAEELRVGHVELVHLARVAAAGVARDGVPQHVPPCVREAGDVGTVAPRQRVSGSCCHAVVAAATAACPRGFSTFSAGWRRLGG